MKKLLWLILAWLPLLTKAQDIKEYKAINGITYHVNDTVRLGKGSNNNGSFAYIEDRGFGMPGPPGRGSGGRGLQKEFINGSLIIKSIKKNRVNNTNKYLFMVSGAGPFRLTMTIDDAILACEVTPCKNTADNNSKLPVPSVADEIKKLKDLMDAGAITKEEFETRKKKLLDQ